MTKPRIEKYQPEKDYYFREGCWINELSNSANDPDVSIALARVEVGVTTQWHRLKSTTERYVIQQGQGLVEIEGLDPTPVSTNDVIVIPKMAWQRIQNTGEEDLEFLAICSPRFEPAAYEERSIE